MTDLSLSAPGRRVPLGAALRAALAVVLALVAAVALAACVSVLTGCSSDEAASMRSGVEAAVEGAATDESGGLVVASALNSEPYEQATSTNQIGFIVKLLRLVGERAGLDVQFAKAVNHKDADQNITPGRPEDVAAKVAAGNEALLTTVNEALAALRADGSYDALHDSWFGDAGIINEAAASREKGTGNAPEAVQDSTGA